MSITKQDLQDDIDYWDKRCKNTYSKLSKVVQKNMIYTEVLEDERPKETGKVPKVEKYIWKP